MDEWTLEVPRPSSVRCGGLRLFVLWRTWSSGLSVCPPELLARLGSSVRYAEGGEFRVRFSRYDKTVSTEWRAEWSAAVLPR